MISHDLEKGISNDKQDFSFLVRNKERKNSVGKGRMYVTEPGVNRETVVTMLRNCSEQDH